MRTKLKLIVATLAIAFTSGQAIAQNTAKDVTVIELAQVSGEFTTKELKLKPGKYQFKVMNQGVEKDLGFVIQKAADKDKDVMKTAVPNSFTTNLIKKDAVEYTGVVELTKGEYVYSCPLNPTPQYKLMVE
jgi:hypothetical protein